MRTLVRARTLLAMGALMLALAAPAAATELNRPIDLPGGPPTPVPVPVQVGDPDAGGELVALMLGRHIIIIRVRAGLTRWFSPDGPRPAARRYHPTVRR